MKVLAGVALLLMPLVAGCGGAGDSDEPCPTATTLGLVDISEAEELLDRRIMLPTYVPTGLEIQGGVELDFDRYLECVTSARISLEAPGPLRRDLPVVVADIEYSASELYAGDSDHFVKVAESDIEIAEYVVADLNSVTARWSNDGLAIGVSVLGGTGVDHDTLQEEAIKIIESVISH